MLGQLSLGDAAPFAKGQSVAQALLTPTRIYVKSLLKALKTHKGIKALAHITGGGFTENIPRVLPKGTVAEIDLAAIPFAPVFRWLAKTGGVAEAEMLRTFNCGVGMIVVVKPSEAKAVAATLKRAGEKVVTLGTIAKRRGSAPHVVYSGALAL